MSVFSFIDVPFSDLLRTIFLTIKNVINYILIILILMLYILIFVGDMCFIRHEKQI